MFPFQSVTLMVSCKFWFLVSGYWKFWFPETIRWSDAGSWGTLWHILAFSLCMPRLFICFSYTFLGWSGINKCWTKKIRHVSLYDYSISKILRVHQLYWMVINMTFTTIWINGWNLYCAGARYLNTISYYTQLRRKLNVYLWWYIRARK